MTAHRNIKPIHHSLYEEEKYSIIIPSAGMGKRMKSFGPKSLIKLKPNLNILENQINIINKIFPINEIILVVGYDGDYLMNHSSNSLIKIENERYETTNVTRSIGIGLRAVTTERVVIIYGDLVFNEQTLLNTDFSNRSTILVDNTYMKEEEIGCFIENKKIINMDWDQKTKWSQISYFTGKELKLLKNIAWNRSKEMFYGFECINEIINNLSLIHI